MFVSLSVGRYSPPAAIVLKVFVPGSDVVLGGLDEMLDGGLVQELDRRAPERHLYGVGDPLPFVHLNVYAKDDAGTLDGVLHLQLLLQDDAHVPRVAGEGKESL